MRELGRSVHGKNAATLRRWAERWEIDTSHLPRRADERRPTYTRDEAATAVAASRSWSETLRRLGFCHSGANWRTLQKRVAEWGINTEHFDPHAASNEALRKDPVPLEDVLVEGSRYSRWRLKQRLYEAGLKNPLCELCGQGDVWRGKRLGLILDHVNGVRDDNRLDNLRIVCPNCAATLDTHCGRKNRLEVMPRECKRCGALFKPGNPRQSYCSRYCGTRWNRAGVKRPGARKVRRPGRRQLLDEIERLGYLGVGRLYGVSDNAIRKWAREYEREAAIVRGENPDLVEIPTRTWPNRRRAA